jgi:hypothetical protein
VAPLSEVEFARALFVVTEEVVIVRTRAQGRLLAGAQFVVALPSHIAHEDVVLGYALKNIVGQAETMLALAVKSRVAIYRLFFLVVGWLRKGKVCFLVNFISQMLCCFPGNILRAL